MAVIVRMPSVLAGATEAALAQWLVSPGDSVRVGTPIAELETEKALVEYAAEEAGVIGRLLLGEGDSGAIGDPIAVLLAPGETDADIDAALGRPPAAAPEPASAATQAAPAVPAGAARPASAAAAPANGHGAAVRGGRVFASPLVRKLAGERGVDLAGLAGTGPNGRIVRRDLERFLAAEADVAARPAPAPALASAAAPASAPAPGGVAGGGEAEQAHVLDDAGGAPAAAGSAAALAGATLIPHTPMRRAIARRLTESKATVPHFYLVADCVADELLALRGRVNATSPAKVSVNDFVLAAVAAAFGDVPEANVTWTDEG